jgi:ribulose kinase
MSAADDYYLWCDHRAFKEVQEITARAHAAGLEAIDWCGGVYSHEWDLPSCCIGCGTSLKRSAQSSLPRSNIAT